MKVLKRFPIREWTDFNFVELHDRLVKIWDTINENDTTVIGLTSTVSLLPAPPTVESFQTAAFSVSPGVSATKTVSFVNTYTSAPNFALGYRNDAPVATQLYSEDFESHASGASMNPFGWTWHQFSDNTGTFKTIPGKYGEIVGSTWAGGFILDEGADWGDVSIEFDVIAAAGGRFVFGWRLAAGGGYWLQCLPGSQSRVFEDRGQLEFVTSTNYAVGTQETPPGTVTHVKITMVGDVINVYYNGSATPLHSFTSNLGHDTGSIGVSAYNSGWQVDNIVVSTVPADAGTTRVCLYTSSLNASQAVVGLTNLDATNSATGTICGVVTP